MYSVNWTTKVITIPVSDMQLVSGTEYKLIMSDFHKEIRRLEWVFTEGFWADQILDHTNSKVVGGNTLPPVDEIINEYKIILDPTATRVIAEGSNNNLLDVQIANGVSLGVTAFGVGGSALTEEEAYKINKIYQALMLDPTAPVTTSEDSITFDDVEIDLVGDPNVQIVGTRKP